MNTTPSASNVLAVYNGSHDRAIREGLSRHLDAHNIARTVGGGRAQHFSRNAGIIAALSPMNGWDNNKRKAAQLISQRGRITIDANGSNGIGLSKNVEKAIAIYNGADPLDVLGGDK